MTRNALDGVALLVEWETLGSERHALIELHVVSEDAGLADDHARSMVDGEMAAYCGAWVDVDSRFRMCPDSPRAIATVALTNFVFGRSVFPFIDSINAAD